MQGVGSSAVLDLVTRVQRFTAEYRTGATNIKNLGASNGRSAITTGGTIYYASGVQFTLAGKVKDWKIIIAIEPDESYTVYVWRAASLTEAGVGVVVARQANVYWDTLYATLVGLYRQYVPGVKTRVDYERKGYLY